MHHASHTCMAVKGPQWLCHKVIEAGWHVMQTELTLMAVPSRNIPLPTLRKYVEKRMMENLQLVTKGQDDTSDVELLKAMCSTLDGEQCVAHCMSSCMQVATLHDHNKCVMPQSCRCVVNCTVNKLVWDCKRAKCTSWSHTHLA